MNDKHFDFFFFFFFFKAGLDFTFEGKLGLSVICFVLGGFLLHFFKKRAVMLDETPQTIKVPRISLIKGPCVVLEEKFKLRI